MSDVLLEESQGPVFRSFPSRTLDRCARILPARNHGSTVNIKLQTLVTEDPRPRTSNRPVLRSCRGDCYGEPGRLRYLQDQSSALFHGRTRTLLVKSRQ